MPLNSNASAAPPKEAASRLGTQKIIPLLISFSLPAIVGMVVNALYNVVDRIFVGQSVGALGIAAITVNFPIAVLSMASSVIVGFGANALFAIRMGEGKREEAERIFGNAAVLLVALPLALAIAVLAALDPLLLAIGASQDCLPLARDYTRIVMLGAVFSSFSGGMTHFIRTDGHPRTAMSSQLIGALINIALDALLVLGFGLGVKGVAWATVAAQISTTVYVLAYFTSRHSTVKFRRRNFRLDLRHVVLPFLFLGLPQCVMQIANSVINTLLNRGLLEHGGDLAVSAVGVVMSANTLIIFPILGLTQGAQPILGYNFGARKFDRVLSTFKWACLGVTAFSILGWIASELFAPAIVRIFSSDDAALLAVASHGMRLFNLMLPLVGFQILTASMFQSLGKPMRSLLLSLSRQILLLIPLLLLLPRLFGLDGIWCAVPIADLLSALLAATLCYRELQRLRAGEGAFTLSFSAREAPAESR